MLSVFGMLSFFGIPSHFWYSLIKEMTLLSEYDDFGFDPHVHHDLWAGRSLFGRIRNWMRRAGKRWFTIYTA